MIHAMADVQSDQIGPDTRIWQYSIVLPGAVIGAGCNVNAHCLIEGGARLGDRVKSAGSCRARWWRRTIWRRR